VKATPNISLAVPTSTPTKPELEGSSAEDARRGALEEEGSHKRKNMEAPGTKKPDSNSTQTLNETLKNLDDLIEDALHASYMMLPFYKRWWYKYKNWRLIRRYRHVTNL
jgi:hypothetical protein